MLDKTSRDQVKMLSGPETEVLKGGERQSVLDGTVHY